MKTPFKITFKKEINGNIRNEKIINDFKYNLKLHSFVYFSRLAKNILTAKNEYYRFKMDINPFGDFEEVEIKIQDRPNNKKEISYSLSLLKLLRLTLILLIIEITISVFSNPADNLYDFLFIFIFFISLFFIPMGIMILRNYSLFNRTLKYGAGNIKYYNWDNIIKTKTDKELQEIISGKSNYSDRVIIFAKKEFEKRHSENKNIH